MPTTSATVSSGVLRVADANSLRTVSVGGPDWWAWIESADATSFRYEHHAGSYTARRETKASGVYWYAYSRRAGRLLKVYLGRGIDLRPERLEGALRGLAERGGQSTAFRRATPAPSDPLLATKLLVPTTASTLIHRQRLLDLLNSGARGRLTLLSAPAGFGKTALLADWASRRSDVAWLTLGPGDNDPTRLLSYVVGALQRLWAWVGVDALALLKAPQPPPLESILTALINDLAAVGSDVMLVIDDYQLTSASATIRIGLEFVVEHLPPNAHLLMAGRVDPQLPLARWRTRGEMTEIRLADLRFTPDEAAELLNGVMRLRLLPSDLSALVGSTEGWPAGLQLAALSVRGSSDASAFISGLSGSNRYILDYLADEVLAQQPAEVQDFLLRTSVLDLLTAPLCEAVRGDEPDPAGVSGVGAQDMLEHLERSNLFIEPVGTDRRWYRYHRLFAEVLRERLARTEPSALPSLHLRAARWHARNGMTEAAIGHALQAGDIEFAADLVSAVARRVLMRSEIATLTDWLGQLPEAAIAARPRLCLCQAWSVLAIGSEFELAETRLRDAERAIRDRKPDSADADDLESISAEIDAVRAMVALIKGDITSALAMAEGTLARLPRDSFVRSVAAMGLAVLYTMSGDLETAVSTCEEAVRAASDSDNLMIGVMALGNLAEARIAQGRLREAASVYRQAERLIAESGGRQLPASGIPEVGLGELLREWNDLPAALEHLTRGVERCRQLGEIVAFDGLLFLARTRQAVGDAAGAVDALARADRLAHRLDSTRIDDATVALCQARLWLLQGNVEAAERWAVTLGAPQWQHLPVIYAEMRDLTHARVELARARPDRALALVKPLLEPARRAGRGRTVIEGGLIAALALAQQCAETDALSHLEAALARAEPEGYVRVFADEGNPLADLLEAALRRRRHRAQGASGQALRTCSPAYIRTLLTALGRMPAPGAQRSDLTGSSIVEPLSDREREVLRLIESGRSNRQIANALVIAETTAKWHVANILGKLGVRSRTQAIARARELRLTD